MMPLPSIMHAQWVDRTQGAVHGRPARFVSKRNGLRAPRGLRVACAPIGQQLSDVQGLSGAVACMLGAQVKREVQDFVADVLKPLYASRSISKDEYKHIMAKAVANVLTHTSLKPGEPFMSSKRRGKIQDLVLKYVKTCSS